MPAHQTTIVDIIVRSNATRQLTKDSAAAYANKQAYEANSRAQYENTAARNTNNGIIGKLLKRLGIGTALTNANTRSKIRNAIATRLAAIANQRLGVNIGMLSFRIKQYLLPVLAALASAMVPVIAGLLAVASAALTASLAVGSLLGLGLYQWSKNFEDSAQGMDVRPYKSGDNEKSFMSHVMKNTVDVMNQDRFKGKIQSVTDWVKHIFNNVLPDAFENFLKNVDPQVVKQLMNMFEQWLPRAAGGLSKWASAMLKLTDGRALEMVSNFFTYLAQGLLKVGRWLDSGGFEQLSTFFSYIRKVLSFLFDFGRQMLPVLNALFKVLEPLAWVIGELMKAVGWALGNRFKQMGSVMDVGKGAVQGVFTGDYSLAKEGISDLNRQRFRIASDVDRHVRRATGGAITPELHSSLTGDAYDRKPLSEYNQSQVKEIMITVDDEGFIRAVDRKTKEDVDRVAGGN